jgi:hypothetical protein
VDGFDEAEFEGEYDHYVDLKIVKDFL